MGTDTRGCYTGIRQGRGPNNRQAAYDELQDLLAGAADDRALNELRKKLVPALGPKAEEAIMTIGQQLIEQGRKEGQRATLLRLAGSRFGELPPATKARIESAGADDLDRWTDRLLAATRLEDLFA